MSCYTLYLQEIQRKPSKHKSSSKHRMREESSSDSDDNSLYDNYRDRSGSDSDDRRNPRHNVKHGPRYNVKREPDSDSESSRSARRNIKHEQDSDSDDSRSARYKYKVKREQDSDLKGSRNHRYKVKHEPSYDSDDDRYLKHSIKQEPESDYEYNKPLKHTIKREPHSDSGDDRHVRVKRERDLREDQRDSDRDSLRHSSKHRGRHRDHDSQGRHANHEPHNITRREPREDRSGHRDRARQEQRESRNRNDDRRRDNRQRRDNFLAEQAQGSDSAAASAQPTQPKDGPNFELSGKLTVDTNTYKGVVIKYNEPPEARKPKRRWRLYPFKNDEALKPYHMHRQSAFLLGRDRLVADIPIDHPSCSKQHAVFQYRLVEYKKDDGRRGRKVAPYIIDLGSANGTFVNNKQIEAERYVELMEKDVIKFGFSSREYVLLHDNSDTTELDEDSS